MKKIRFVIVLFSFVLLGACSWGNDNQESSESVRDVGVAPTTEDSGGMGLEATAENGLIGDKVIKTVFSSYETLEYESTIQHVLELNQKYAGYVEYSYESTYSPSGSFTPEGSSRQYRRMEYTLRIPTASLTSFLKDMEGAEAVKVSEQVGSQDITQSYRDTEARINVLRQKEERLNELLTQATTIDQILQIENSLSDTIAEREALQAQLDSYDDLIDYTQVHLTVTERMRVSSTRGDSLPFLVRVREAFLDSLYAFYYWVQDAAIWFIYLLPFLVVLGLLLLAFLAARRFYRRSNFAKKRAAERETSLKRIRERGRHPEREPDIAASGKETPADTSQRIKEDKQDEGHRIKSESSAPHAESGTDEKEE